MDDVAPVVVHVDDVAVERWDDPSRGAVEWRTLISADRTPTCGVTLGVADLPAGAGADDPAHRHEPPEIYFVLSGAGVVEIDGVRTPVTAQTAVFIPSMAAHRLINNGPAPLRLLYGFPIDSFSDVNYVFPSS